MKRILIFSLAYYPRHIGGAEIAIKEITDRISDIEFHLITNRFDTTLIPEEIIGRVHVHRVGFGRAHAGTKDTSTLYFYFSKIWFIPCSAYKAWKLHREYAFDGAWAMMSYMVFPLMLLRLCGVRIPYVLTLQEGDPFEHVFDRWYIRPFRFLLKKGFAHATVIQAISTFLGTWPRTLGFTGPLHVIPNGVSVAHFSRSCDPLKHTIPSDRTEHTFVLVTSSRLVKKNGLDLVIDALPHLPSDVKFVIYGDGPEEVSLQAQAVAQGVSSRVSFMGHIDHTLLPCALKSADVFIRPSRSEGMGNSFIEAMVARIPVIGTPVGGITDFLRDPREGSLASATGYYVKPKDSNSIVETITHMRAHADEVEAVVLSAHAIVSSRFDWVTIAHDMREKVFCSLWK